jgi:hypothetical protein
VGIVIAIVIVSVSIVVLKSRSPFLVNGTVALSPGDIKVYPIQAGHTQRIYIQISVSGQDIEWKYDTKDNYEQDNSGFEFCSEGNPVNILAGVISGHSYVVAIRSGDNQTKVSIVKVKVSTEPIPTP